MNEEYLKGLHGSLGIKDDYSVWVEKVKGNDKYLKGLHGSIGVKDDYDTWKSAVWGDVKKKEETVSPEPTQVSPEPVQEPAQISTESVQEPIKSPLISSESKDDDLVGPTRTEEQAKMGGPKFMDRKALSANLQEEYIPTTSQTENLYKPDLPLEDVELKVSKQDADVAKKIFDKTVDRYADPKGPVEEIGGYAYEQEMKNRLSMSENVQDPKRQAVIINELSKLHGQAINKNLRNAREVSQKKKENNLVKDFGKESLNELKSNAYKKLWGKETFDIKDTKDRSLDDMVDRQLRNGEYERMGSALDSPRDMPNIDADEYLRLHEKSELDGLKYLYEKGSISFKNPLKQEEYQGYVSGLMSSESKEYAYNEDMKAIKAEERMLSDSEESSGAFGGESFDAQASRRKKAVDRLNSSFDFTFEDRFMTTHELKISKWVNELEVLKKKANSKDISEDEKSRLEKEIAVVSKRIKGARDNGADLLFDPATGKPIYESEASEEAKQLNKEIDERAIKLTGNTRTDLQNMRRDLYWRFQYLDSKVNNNIEEVAEDAPWFGLRWSEREDLEYANALPLYGGSPLLDEYRDTYQDMIAVNRALMLNEDPGTIERGLWATFGESLAEAVGSGGGRVSTEEDIIEAFGSAMNEYGVELSQAQRDRIQDSFGEEVVKGIANTIPELGKFIAISLATEGLGIGKAIESSFSAMKLATNSKTAKALLTFLEPTLKMEAQFQLAGQDAGTGAGEAIGQMSYDALGIDKLLNSLPFTKKWKAIVNTVLKTSAGATGETVQEYTGEMLNRLVEGEEFGEALMSTIGDDPARKALLTYLISSTMSLGTMGSNYKKSMKIMEDNVLNQVSSDPEIVAAQKKIVEDRGKELKDARNKVEEGSSELDKINKQIQELEGIKGKLYGDFSGGAKEEGDVVNIKETEGELSNYTVDGKVRSDKQVIENLSDPEFVEKVKSGKTNLDIRNPSPEVKAALEGSGLLETKQDVKKEITPEEEVVETPIEGEQQVTEDVAPSEPKVYSDISENIEVFGEFTTNVSSLSDLENLSTEVKKVIDLGKKLDSENVTWKINRDLGVVDGRQIIEIIASNGDKFLMYNSTGEGTGAASKGQWVPMLGFSQDGGFIKGAFNPETGKTFTPRGSLSNENNPKFNKYGSKTFKKIAEELESGTQEVTEGVEVPQLKDREVSELENRMTEIENSKDPSDKKEFNDIENELQSREWKTILDAPMDKLNEVLDDLAKKDKEMPNGFGTFIDPESIREIKEIAEKYSPENTSELTDQQVKKDFQLALNETGNNLEEASSFRMREALKEASERGITIESLIETAVNKYVNDGFDKKTGEEVVASKLEKYLNKTKQDEQTRSTDGTVLDKKESQQSAETKKPKFQKSKETQEDLQQGKDEARLLKEGKTTTTKPVKIFKGLGGKKDLSGARINAHEGAEGVFSSIDESEAADYGREEGVSESVLPEGTTMEVVEVDGTGMTTSQYRKAEVEAINNSDAQVVKLVTVDGVMKKGARKQEQYIIKDPKLIEDVKKTKEQVPSDRTDGETPEGTSTDQETGSKKTGKERLKAAIKEYSERQKKETEDFRAKAEAKPKAPRDARKVFKKQNAGEVDSLTKKAKTEGKKEALGTIKNIIKALGSINPDLEVVVHETEQSYLEDMGKEAKGTSGVLATDGKIHLNLPRVKDNTTLHEAAHVVMAAHMKANPEAITEFKGQLEGILPKSGVDSLTDFASEYESDGKQTVDEEFVIEALSRIANGSIVLTKTRLDKLKALLRNLAKKLGMTPSQIKLTGKEDVVRFSEKLTEAFSEGREITTEAYKVEGNKVKFQKTKKETDSVVFPERVKAEKKAQPKKKEIDATEVSPELKKVYEDIDRILGRKPGTTKTASKRSLNVNINKLKRKAEAIKKQAEADKKSLEHVVEELGRPISIAEAQALLSAGMTPKKSIPQLIEEKKANIRRLAGQLGSTTNMGVGPNAFKMIGELIGLAKLKIIQGASTFKDFLKSIPFPFSKTLRKIYNGARLGLNSNYKPKKTYGVKNLDTRQAQEEYLKYKTKMKPVTSVDNLLSQLDEMILNIQIRIDTTLDAYEKGQLEKAKEELVKEYNDVRLQRYEKGVSDADVLAGLQIKLDDKLEAVTEDSRTSLEYESMNFWERVIKAGIVDSQYAQKRVQKLIKDQTGEGVPASKDPYILNDLQRGKVQRKIEKIMNYVTGERFGHISLSAVGIAKKSTKKDSLIGRMKSKDISRNELGRFMLFRHVKERNKRMKTLRIEARKEAIEAAKEANVKLISRLRTSDLSAKELKKELKKAAQELENNLKKIEKELPILEKGDYCGVTNEKAQEYLDSIDPVKKENMTEFAKEYKENVLDKTVDIYLEAGLINKENAYALKNGTDSKTGDKFDFYVPMKVNGDIINDIIEASGVTSESSKRNTDGLRSLQAASKSNKFKAFDRINPFDQGLYDMQYAVVKAEQNETRKALLDMVQKNRNEDLWEVYREYPPEYTLKKGDIPRVPFGKVDPSSLIRVKKDGKTFLINIKADELRDSWIDDSSKSGALRAAASIYKVLNKVSSKYMNFKRSILTTLNPSFAVPNLIRDVQDALFNIKGLEGLNLDDSIFERLTLDKVQKKFLKNVPRAMRGFAQNKQGKKDREWAKIYQEMVDYGGEISWMHLGDVSETINDINERINKGWWSKTKRVSGATSILDGIELFNSTLEQGTRVSIYKTVSDLKIMNIKKGVKKWKNLSEQELENISEAEVKKIAPEAFNDAKTEAASAAKNVTINFNRKGHLGGVINSVWMFSNAGFQGAATGLNTLTTKRGRRFASKTLLFGAAYQAFLNYMTDDEEWKKIESRYDLENNFVLPIDLSTGECITIPKSYGPMRALINIGGYLFDSGVKTYDGKFGAGVSELIFRTANEAHKIMDPISGSNDNVLSSFTPEVVKPIIENWTNRNYRNKRIVPNRYHKPDGSVGYLNESQEMDKPDRLKYYDDIAPAFITMAGYADDMGLDFSPEELEHLFEGYVYAGVVRDLGDMSIDIYSGEFETSNLGIIKRFYKNPTEEQRTWRKRAKVDELTILSNNEIFDEKQMSLLRSLLDDLYPVEGYGGKTGSRNLQAWRREWRSIKENQERLKEEQKQ